MSIKASLDQNLKQAMLGGDRVAADTLKGIKSAILNEEIAKGSRDTGLSDDAVIAVLKKESKKRQEAAELYQKAGSEERAKKELKEKAIIDEYLPQAMTDEEINKLIDAILEQQGEVTPATMGKIIGAVKQSSGGQADGSDIARLVKARIA